MNKRITNEEAQLYGIVTFFEEMPNKERRFRLNSNDGSSYCRTEASTNGAWQNSHFHKGKTEVYIVQSGTVLFAIKDGEVFTIKKFGAGDSITISPFCPHNLYLYPDAVIHTIKYSSSSSYNHDPDWFSSKELDQWIANL